jgi:hypothetical protein
MRSATPTMPSQSVNVFIGMLALAMVYFSGTLAATDVKINAKDCKHLHSRCYDSFCCNTLSATSIQLDDIECTDNV